MRVSHRSEQKAVSQSRLPSVPRAEPSTAKSHISCRALVAFCTTMRDKQSCRGTQSCHVSSTPSGAPSASKECIDFTAVRVRRRTINNLSGRTRGTITCEICAFYRGAVAARLGAIGLQIALDWNARGGAAFRVSCEYAAARKKGACIRRATQHRLKNCCCSPCSLTGHDAQKREDPSALRHAG